VVFLLMWIGCLKPCSGSASDEQRFALLQIGTQTYRNVTVTTKSKDYVFILHSAGMTNIKVKDLSPELRQRLGYVEAPPPKSVAATANDWAKQSLGKIETPKVKAFEGQFLGILHTGKLDELMQAGLSPRLFWQVVGGVAALYLFFCYCCQLLCLRAGKKPGVLVWLPLLQMFPLLDAAGMSRWWFLGLFVPGVNLVGTILWCIKIAKVRGKSAGFAILLLLPVLNVLAFLYLAFSSGAAPTKEKRRVEIMTLEAA
jgi:Family of unknown function (DUF5684)